MRKKKPLKIVDISDNFKSKPTQIIQSQVEPDHAVVDNLSFYIAKRAAERLKEKEK